MVQGFKQLPSRHHIMYLGNLYGTDLYFGSALAYGITTNTYSKYPDYYPEGYYQNNALHVNPYIGIQVYSPVRKRKSDKIAFYMELGTVDTQIGHAILNRSITFFDIWNLGFGFVIPCKK
jgi:hypothetical protein